MPVIPTKVDPRPVHAPKDIVGKDVIYPEPYRHAVVDSKEQIYTSLLTNLPGMKWTGWLYTQVKGAQEEFAPFDRNKDIPLQQYRLIKDYEMLVQGNLTQTIEDDGTVLFRGTAITYPLWMVNYGDIWIADVGQGQAGFFTVTAVTKKTMFKESIYELSLSMVEPMSAELARVLPFFVQETYHFQRDFLKYGQNPYLIEDEYANKKELEKMRDTHHEIYANQFMNHQVKSFVVPEPSNAPTYDPFVTKAVTSMIDLMKLNILARMNRFNVADFGIEDAITLFDCLLQRKPELLCCTAVRKVKLINVRQMQRNVRYHTFAFSGYRNLVTPDGGTFDNTGTGNGVVMIPTSNNGCGCATYPDPDDITGIVGTTLGGGGQTPSDGTEGTALPNIHSSAYILSEAFYEGDRPTMTKFERLLWDGMELKTVNAADVLVYYRSWCKWSRQDKFYLGPLLFILTEYALRSLYD